MEALWFWLAKDYADILTLIALLLVMGVLFFSYYGWCLLVEWIEKKRKKG